MFKKKVFQKGKLIRRRIKECKLTKIAHDDDEDVVDDDDVRVVCMNVCICYVDSHLKTQFA